MKKTLLSLLCALTLLICALPPALAQTTVANAATDTGLDIVCVIDRSGTMKATDPSNIALVATNMLADIADPQITSIAVVGFGFDVTLDTGFVDLADADKANALKDSVANLGIRQADDTNTGLALQRAKALIDARRVDHPDHSFAILVLSDGKIDIGDYVDAKTAISTRNMTRDQLTDESRGFAMDVANSCAGEGVTISCLGIYPNNDMTKLGTDMEEWTRLTGGTYRMTNDINKTYDLVEEMYMQIKGQADDRVMIGTDGKFTIPAGVSVATITTKPGTPISNLNLTYWDGATGSWTLYGLNPSDVKEDMFSQYTTVKLNHPRAGDYKISFVDGTMAEFDVSVVYDRELVMTLTAPVGMRSQETTSDITIDVRRHGLPYYDPNGAQPVVHVFDENNQPVMDLQTRWDDARTLYLADFTPQHPGLYTLRATQELNGENVSNDVQINVGKASVTKSKDFDPIDFTGHAVRKYDANGEGSDGYAPVEIDLPASGCFSDPDGVGIYSYQLQMSDPNDSQYVDIQLDPATWKLTIRPLKATVNPVSFSVSAVPTDNIPSDPAYGTVTVEDLQDVVRNSASKEAGELHTEGITIKEVLPQKEPVLVVDNLLSLFEEPNAADGEGVVIEDVSETGRDGEKLEILRKGDQLLIKGVQEGDTEVKITARSYDTSTASFTFKVRVVNLMKTYLMIGGGLLAALILAVVIIAAVVNANKPRFKKNAVLGVRLTSEDEDQEGSCILLRYGKGPAKMSDLFVKCGLQTTGLRKQLDGIRIYPRKTASVEIRYDVRGKKRTSVLSHNDSKDIELDRDGDRVLTLTYIEDGADDY